MCSFCCSLSNESEQRCTTLTQDTRQCSGGSYLYLTSLIWQTGAGGSRSLLGMWRMQHRMDLALILKAFSPSLRPSLTSRTTSSGVRSPLGGRGAQRESRQRAQLVTSFPRGSTQTRGFRLRLVVALHGQKVECKQQTTLVFSIIFLLLRRNCKQMHILSWKCSGSTSLMMRLLLFFTGISI